MIYIQISHDSKGKTTALNILAGMHNASSGVALVSGYDVHTELNSVYERLGNCPQFECVWKDQSVQRHLEFYARLKGINDPRAAALNIATAVGLGEPEVYTRLSGALSGGMQRRLSIAVSLLGSPNTLLLDEPTTGKSHFIGTRVDQSQVHTDLRFCLHLSYRIRPFYKE